MKVDFQDLLGNNDIYKLNSFCLGLSIQISKLEKELKETTRRLQALEEGRQYVKPRLGAGYENT